MARWHEQRFLFLKSGYRLLPWFKLYKTVANIDSFSEA